MGLKSHRSLSVGLAGLAEDLNIVATCIRDGRLHELVSENMELLKRLVAYLGDVKVLRVEMEAEAEQGLLCEATYQSQDVQSDDCDEEEIAENRRDRNRGLKKSTSRESGHSADDDKTKNSRIRTGGPSQEDMVLASGIDKVKGHQSNSKNPWQQGAECEAKKYGMSGPPSGFLIPNNNLADQQQWTESNGQFWGSGESCSKRHDISVGARINQHYLDQHKLSGAVKCFRCGLRGHKSQSCVVRCFRCKKVGHGVFSCAWSPQGQYEARYPKDSWKEELVETPCHEEHKEIPIEEKGPALQHGKTKSHNGESGFSKDEQYAKDLFESVFAAWPGEWPERQDDESEIEYLEQLWQMLQEK